MALGLLKFNFEDVKNYFWHDTSSLKQIVVYLQFQNFNNLKIDR